MSQQVPEFVHRFEEAWKEPLTRFPALFHPSGTLLQAGMKRPITADEIRTHQESTLRLMPDLRIRPTRWAVDDDDVFSEWSAAGTINGKAFRWSGASLFTLRDGLVTEEVAYFDTLPLRAAVDPTLAREDMVTAAIDAARVEETRT